VSHNIALLKSTDVGRHTFKKYVAVVHALTGGNYLKNSKHRLLKNLKTCCDPYFDVDLTTVCMSTQTNPSRDPVALRSMRMDTFTE
jgi:hypothetical protein